MFTRNNKRIFETLIKISRCNSTCTKEINNSPNNYTNMLVIHDTASDTIPTYRVIDQKGYIIDANKEMIYTEKLVKDIYKCMQKVTELDKILYECQRQGRISFYMTNTGEEAAQVASSAALHDNDLIYSQYRELGALLWRGLTHEQVMNQCFGNVDDVSKGKQMPVHYGSTDYNFVTISSPLATQLPQAVGSAYAFKLENNGRCVIAYFGEGAASEGDTSAAFNFASTLDCPIIFFCRNNRYAISTPSHEQYNGDGIAGRGLGYGINAIRVDGNDALAVFNATKHAREFVIKNNKPIVLEAMTYRRGHHSTSDDSTAYRPIDEIKSWETHDNPITRLRYLLVNHNWYDEAEDKEWRTNYRKELLRTLNDAEKKKKPSWQEMFNDVYYDIPEHIMEQMKYMDRHLQIYKEHYPMKDFEQN